MKKKLTTIMIKNQRKNKRNHNKKLRARMNTSLLSWMITRRSKNQKNPKRKSRPMKKKIQTSRKKATTKATKASQLNLS